MKLWLLLTLTFILHGIFFVSVFDIFFSTPMYNGLTPHFSPRPPPAKRVVFIIADGLRADKLLMVDSNGKSPAPFLRNIIETKGTWGIAHARPPTATRPGHVALTAGFYEDPTSVAKDIRGKPVLFDTVFNESRYTWSWDTPKFLQKITGGNPNRMYSQAFPGDMKYLAGIDAREMDTWVFDEVKKFLEEAKQKPEIRKQTNETHVLYFLHLGGLDHNGYIVRPSHQTYTSHVTMVDEQTATVVKEFEDFYSHDGKTAYVFASDHGMTDWGGHGDGSLDETLTPLIAWGAGISGPVPETNQHADGLSAAWKLDKIRRTDMDQASMAPLLAAVVGIPFPMNALHPVPDQLFNLTDQDMAEMLLANLQQLTEQYREAMRVRATNTLALTFTPFKPLTPGKVSEVHATIKTLIAREEYKKAIEMTKMSIDLTIKGLSYYRNYNRVLLWCSMVLSFVGWMVYILTHVVEELSNGGLKPKSQMSSDNWQTRSLIIFLFSASGVITAILLYVQSMPVLNFFYILPAFPIWLLVARRVRYLQEAWTFLSASKSMVAHIAICLVGLEAIVLGFYQREVYSVVLIGFAVWPFLNKLDQLEKRILMQWLLSCLSLAVFPLVLSKDRAMNFNIVAISGIILLVIASLLAKKCVSKSLAKRKLIIAFGIQLACVAVATVVAKRTASLAEANTRTPLINQILSWTVLVVSLVMPVTVTTDLRSRLLSIALSFLAPYILFSVAHEILFLMFLCWNLFVFILLESSLNTIATVSELPTTAMENGVNGRSSPRRVTDNGKWLDNVDLANLASLSDSGKCCMFNGLPEMRRSLYFLFLCSVSLYGTGHIPSVSSFDAASVYCFLTVSNPPFMGSLMVFKIVIPFILIFCGMKAMNLVLQVPSTACCLITVLMTDIITLSFFLMVTDTGSFEEMGKTLGHFIIMAAGNLIYLLLYGLSTLLTTRTLCCQRKH